MHRIRLAAYNVTLWLVLVFASPSHSATILSENFDVSAVSGTSACWVSRPNAGGTENTTGCGNFAPISEPAYSTPRATMRLDTTGPAHSGARSVYISYPKDEALAYAQHNLPAGTDHIFFTQWVYFDANFDFALGQKMGRIDIWDSINDVSLSSFIIVVYCANCGSGLNDGIQNDMGGITFNKNGGENYGYADGVVFTRGTWYKVEMEIKLNTPSSSNGEARLWVNDSLVASRTGMGGTDMRPSGGDTRSMSFLRIGGWDSNSSSDPYPSAMIYWTDDVCLDDAARCNASDLGVVFSSGFE